MSASVSSSERFLVHGDLSCCHTLLCSHMTITSNIDHSPHWCHIPPSCGPGTIPGCVPIPGSMLRDQMASPAKNNVCVSFSASFILNILKLLWNYPDLQNNFLSQSGSWLLNVSMIWVWTDVWDASWGGSCYQQALSSNHRSLTHFHI